MHIRLPVSVSLIISSFDIEFKRFKNQVKENSYQRDVFNDLMFFPSPIVIKSIKNDNFLLSQMLLKPISSLISQCDISNDT